MMIEFELPSNHPLIVSLDKMLTWVRKSNVPSRLVGDPNQCVLTEERLNERIEKNVANYCRMARFDSHEEFDFSDVQKHSTEIYKEKTGREGFSVIPVAKTRYPPGEGYLGWHIDQTGGRMYSAFAEGKSFFRYRDPDTKEIITSWDKPGQWSFRIFDFDEENPMWHCVKAEDLRVSTGYRFV